MVEVSVPMSSIELDVVSVTLAIWLAAAAAAADVDTLPLETRPQHSVQQQIYTALQTCFSRHVSRLGCIIFLRSIQTAHLLLKDCAGSASTFS